LSLSGFTLPGPLALSAQIVAKSAGGASLFALGLMLYGERVKLDADVLINVAIKNVGQPVLMLAGAVMFALPHTITVEAVLTGAAPAATAASMFALKNKAYTTAATSTVLISTLSSIAIVAVLIALIGK
jgi:predicted permease